MGNEVFVFVNLWIVLLAGEVLALSTGDKTLLLYAAIIYLARECQTQYLTARTPTRCC